METTTVLPTDFATRATNIVLIITSTTAAYGKLLYWLLYIKYKNPIQDLDLIYQATSTLISHATHQRVPRSSLSKLRAAIFIP